MNKSFKDRLVALEALEAQAEQARAPLTDEERLLLFEGIEHGSVTMHASGRLVAYQPPPALDLALARCNTALAAMRPPLTTLEDIDAWIRELPDVDSFDDDELILEIFRGLGKRDFVVAAVSFARGSLQVLDAQPASLRRYWAGIVARGAPLVKERAITFFPLFPADIRAAIEQIDRGVITCQPLPKQAPKSHRSTVLTTEPPPTPPKRYSLHECLIWALDEYMYQTDCAPIETTDELRADLVAALEQFSHAELEETA